MRTKENNMNTSLQVDHGSNKLVLQQDAFCTKTAVGTVLTGN